MELVKQKEFTPKLYIIMRDDLPSMNSGKGMAQASHAVAQFLYTCRGREHCIDDWCSQCNGFGTTVVMSADKESINNLYEEYERKTKSKRQGKIIDTEYPFYGQLELIKLLDTDGIINYHYNSDEDKDGMVKCTREEMTCSWVYIDNEDNWYVFNQLCTYYGVTLHQ